MVPQPEGERPYRATALVSLSMVLPGTLSIKPPSLASKATNRAAILSPIGRLTTTEPS